MQSRVKGADLLKKDFKRLANNKEALKAAVFSGGLLILNGAIKKAPVLTGTLRRSGQVRIEMRGKVIVAVISFNTPYARRIEYGFTGVDSKGRKYNQPARPYIRPSFDENKGKAIKEIKASLEAQL